MLTLVVPLLLAVCSQLNCSKKGSSIHAKAFFNIRYPLQPFWTSCCLDNSDQGATFTHCTTGKMARRNDYEDEERSPTGLERLAGLLAATKEDAAAEISKLSSQVGALNVERRLLEDALESCQDELGDANSLVDQLRLENTRKWRVEERDDWRALLDSMQVDRTDLQQQNARLEGELTRCITALRTIYPLSSPRKAGGAGAERAGTVKREISDEPPELARHRSDSGALVDNKAVVDLEWLDALAEEFNVVCEGGSYDGDGGAGELQEGGGGGRQDTVQGPPMGGDTECARLRLELDGVKHDAETARASLERQVLEQEQQLRQLRGGVPRAREGAVSSHEDTQADIGGGGGSSFSGVFRWWRHDRSHQTADGGKRGEGRGAAGSSKGRVTVV